MRHCLPTRLLVLSLGLGFFLLTTGVFAQGKVKSGEEIYKEILKATVLVLAPKGAPVNGKQQMSMGSGSFIDKGKRIVITNYHVVGDNDKVHIFFPVFDKGRLIPERDHYLKLLNKGGSIVGQVIAKDPKHDLALVQLATLPENARVIPLAQHSPSPGQRVYSIGNPGSSGALWVYTSGDVRAVYRKQWKAGGDGGRVYDLDAQVVETQSPTNKGDSGGPLVNDQGHLVAVTQGSVAGAQLLSLFIDVSEVRTLLVKNKIKASAAPSAVVLSDTPKPDKKPDKPVLSDEQEAERRLNLARVLADSGKVSSARERYEEIIRKYPKTPAAEEARKLLKK